MLHDVRLSKILQKTLKTITKTALWNERHTQ